MTTMVAPALAAHKADAAAEADGKPVTVLANLRARINAQVVPVKTTVDIPVAYREGWAFRYSTVHPYEDVMTVAATAQDENMPQGVHYVNLGLALGTELCRGLLLDGEEVLDDQGQPLTFASVSLQRELGALNATDCVRKALAMPVEDAAGVHWEPDEMGIAGLGQTLFAHVQGVHPTQR